MSRIEERYRDRVREVAVKLDADRPNWPGRINKRRLDLGSTRLCLLGQVYGHYGRGVRMLGIPWFPLFREARACNPPPWRQEMVRRLWLAEIDARLEREPLVDEQRRTVDR